MSKKKKISIICICIAVLLLATTVIQGIRIYNQEKDPYWQAAEKLYNVESALKEMNKEWELQSLTTVTPYTYANTEGDTIIYYHCQTAYVADEEIKVDSLNTVALEQVVDITSLENTRNCEINGLPAVIGEMEGRTYLCWTLSPKHSCVIEYSAEANTEDSIFQMAESISLP